ncbi:MAG: allantoate amidohydrolase [Candidatus Dormibacteria bacterium]
MSELGVRLRQIWRQLEPIGRTSVAGGYRRFAWNDADLACREWFQREATSLDLAVETDRNGNLWAWWDVEGERTGAVVTGSHLDSVPEGGAFDGPLGVAGGLLAVDLLRKRGARPLRPLAVACFADEEGSRFGVACAGSRLLTGALDAGRAHELYDRDGISMAAAMGAAGVSAGELGRDQELLDAIGVFVELHVEQGRGLVDEGAPVGVATAVWPHGRWRIDLVGEPNHAGTTRLSDRHDPVLPLAVAALEARRAATEAGGVATVGRVEVEPNAVNAVAASAHVWVDVRAPHGAQVASIVAAVTEATRRAGAEHGVEVTVTAESQSRGVGFPAELQTRLVTTLERCGLSAPRLPTGAGHDAAILGAELPAAMLFVRNPTGISHSPAEFAAEADCVAGVEALSAVLEELACR